MEEPASSPVPDRPERIERPRVEAMEKLLGVALPVLDQGFVRLVDYMGSDESIVQAARVSYGKGTKKVHEDRGLIRYLMRHHHTTPLEMCELKLHIRIPMDAWRQYIRHRTASVNEYSTRYSIAIDAAQKTPPDEWRSQSAQNRQGSGEFFPVEIGKELTRKEAELQDHTRKHYEELIQLGVAREQARKDLPLSTYTEAYWKIDLHNLLHFLWLRMDEHAQLEIREFAKTIGHKIVSQWVPHTWEAFQDYRVQSMSLTRLDIEAIAAFQRGGAEAMKKYLADAGLLASGPEGIKKNRERDEMEEKLRKLGLPVPWK